MIELNRRKLITGLIAFGAAPAIVRAASLMPVKVMEPLPFAGDLGFALPAGVLWVRHNKMGALPVYKPDGSVLRAGDLVAGQFFSTVYDGTKWVVV
jgi:hypothetical protein